MANSIGLDLVEVARIASNLKRHSPRFENRILGPREREIFDRRRDRAVYLAGRFAAKEAVIKALGVYLSARPRLRDLQVINDDVGMPQLLLPENIQRELSFEPGEYMVNADPTHLQQVFMNLALNARDAMPSGGILSISMDHFCPDPEDPPTIPELATGQWVRLILEDNGMGIPGDLIPHIFDPFFTTKPIGEGTGLGLAQVYGIIQQHGGVIDVQSNSAGTTFLIYLPELDKAGRSDTEENPKIYQRGAGETLLLVEDDLPARDAIGELLISQGYNIMIARNGVEALQIFENNGNDIDMIISDIVMPKMGGIDLYFALTETRPEMKFLLITGHPLEIEHNAPLKSSLVQWLQKPFSVNELMSLLQSLLTQDSN